MSLSMGMGPAWRHMRTDREAAHARIERGTLRRVLGFAVPHRRTIGLFLALFFLFMRFLPAIAMFEMRTIVPEAKLKAEHHG